MTKWPVQEQTHRTAQKHTEHQEQQTFRMNYFFVFFGYLLFLFLFIIYYLLNDFLQEMVFDFHSNQLCQMSVSGSSCNTLVVLTIFITVIFRAILPWCP